MTAQTKLSAKGQIVIPKDVRDRLGLVEGMVFDVVERGDEVVLRRSDAKRPGFTAQDALREIQTFYRYEGPPVSLEDMDRGVRDMVRQKWERKLAPRRTKP